MPRPRRHRMVGIQPAVTYFKPAGMPLREIEEVVLTVDEFEAIRLKDLLGLDQIEAAEKMDISQPTFHRLLSSARKKVADALVNGKAIRIEGGSYILAQKVQDEVRGVSRPGRGWQGGRGEGQGRGKGQGRGGRNGRGGRGR